MQVSIAPPEGWGANRRAVRQRGLARVQPARQCAQPLLGAAIRRVPRMAVRAGRRGRRDGSGQGEWHPGRVGRYRHRPGAGHRDDRRRLRAAVSRPATHGIVRAGRRDPVTSPRPATVGRGPSARRNLRWPPFRSTRAAGTTGRRTRPSPTESRCPMRLWSLRNQLQNHPRSHHDTLGTGLGPLA